MSQHLEKMQLGDTIEVKGPLGHFIYDGRSQFRSSGKKGTAKKMSMIAGGTGITPMFQIIKVTPVPSLLPVVVSSLRLQSVGIRSELCPPL